MPLWWNWQTRGTQNPVVAIPCRFDPDQRHQNNGQGFFLVRYFFCRLARRHKFCKKKTGKVKIIYCLIWQNENSKFGSYFLKEILPRVPTCGKRQPPKGTDQQNKSFNSSLFCFADRRGRTNFVKKRLIKERLFIV